MITLIAFMGWKEPRYVVFCTRPKPNQGARYLLLRARPEARRKKDERAIFEGYLCDLQESISKMWRITPEVCRAIWEHCQLQGHMTYNVDTGVEGSC
jgi:hypothetical protein